MRCLLSIAISMIIIVFSFCFVGCDNIENSEILRIHIRANSNSENDQEIKLSVRDELVEYITMSIDNCGSCDEVKDTLNNRLEDIEGLADNVLKSSGYEYSSQARISREYFPTRSYDGISFPAGYYDALIVELGTGKGDNWWCVAYPPLCFVGDDMGDSRIRYRSKIIEIIKKYF